MLKLMAEFKRQKVFFIFKLLDVLKRLQKVGFFILKLIDVLKIYISYA